jgi:alpha-beta hydrolase superfamily lysophospholipase
MLAGTVAAWVATAPRPQSIGARADIGGFAAVEVMTRTADGVTVRGWLCSADPTRCVVLAAGIHGNRMSMVQRATWWLQHGWSTLLVDLRGTGASDATPIAMGWHEASDLLAWRQVLAARGFTRIGAHGQSLGAAAMVYASARGGDWSFMVLEACYDDIRHALENRMPWVPLPDLVLWPMLAAAQFRLGVDIDALRPIGIVPRLTMPVLMLAGDGDAAVKRAETEALFAAVGSANKRLVWIHGAAHVDLWTADAAACARTLDELLRLIQ